MTHPVCNMHRPSCVSLAPRPTHPRITPTEQTVQDMLKLMSKTTTRGEISTIMGRLAGRNDGTPSLDECLQAIDRWVLVVSGPNLKEYLPTTPRKDKPATASTGFVCMGCSTFSSKGACAHGYACMLCLGVISSASPATPLWRKTRNMLGKLGMAHLYRKLRREGMNVDELRAYTGPSKMLKELLGVSTCTLSRLLAAVEAKV